MLYIDCSMNGGGVGEYSEPLSEELLVNELVQGGASRSQGGNEGSAPVDADVWP
jgi:hypothetical protein